MSNSLGVSGEGQDPSVLVVILNWNGWEDTLTALESVLRLDYPRLQVLIIDNGSTDGSVEQLRTVSNDQVGLLELPENLGYTGGCNKGFQHALASGIDYVWLVNSDVLMEDRNTLRSLMAIAEGDPKLGLVAPRIAAPGKGGRLTYCGGVCTTDPPMWEHISDPDEARRQAQRYPNAGLVVGTAMLLRTSLVREIGMLDEEFFAYFEDHDYSYRASQAGYRNVTDENSVIRHADKETNDKPLEIKPHWWYYNVRNECRFWRKHLKPVKALKVMKWDLHTTWVHIRRCQANKEATDAILAGLWHGWIGRWGAYRPEYRMPRPLAALVMRYALTRPERRPAGTSDR
jgi:GT2 family glycosyltransferase